MNKVIFIWQRMWFRKDDGLQLEIIRFLIGCLLLVNYVGLTPHLLDLYSQTGWVNLAAVDYELKTPWIISLHFWLSEPWQFFTFHGVFISACLCFTLGYRTQWVKWLVLFGHLSYLHRNPGVIYGVDNILASLLLLLCIAPIGKNFSLDAKRYQHKKVDLKKLNKLDKKNDLELSPWGFSCTRLIQLQMATLFFFSAVDKLKGETWWSGDALWIALNNFEFNNVSVMWLAEHYWIANLMTYATLMIELGYTFLIWGKPTRPYFLIAALLLHLGIAVLMGLYLFAAVMAVGHLAFLRSEWILAFLTIWEQKFRVSVNHTIDNKRYLLYRYLLKPS
ncbi:MAG: HTTM domain-containing protein [Cellvibrionaceae bacterium]